MDLFETLKLNPESALIPIDDVPPNLRARFDSTKAHFVLSRSTARRGALALDMHGAALVKLFSSETTLPKAIKQLSVQSSLPVDQLVTAAYPLLELLIQEEHLIPTSSEHDETRVGDHKALNISETFNNFTILSKVQELDDSVVYKARGLDGELVALKVLRRLRSPAHSSFKREVLILENLRGGVAPRLVEQCMEGPSVFFAMEWIEGHSLVDWASRIRNLPHDTCYAELISLAKSLITAYVKLHDGGVLHGDIWTRNILIKNDGTVRLLDFGLSQFEPADNLLGPAPRATNAYFRSPDLATAELAGETPPSSTIASEIYSLGVMLYFMMTGRNYIHFSYELQEQLKQVCESPMLSFSENGARAWPGMEMLLAAMLEKNPADRIASLEACLDRLSEIAPPEIAQASGKSDDPIPFLRSYIGERFAQPIEAPSASIFFGLGGLSYAMLGAGICLGEPELLQESDYLTTCAKSWITGSPSGSCNPDADIPDHVLGAHSIFHRVEGIALMEALVAHTLGDGQSLRRSCLRFVSGIHENTADAEFAFGKAGLLNALLQLTFLVKESDVLVKQGNELADDIVRELQSYSSICQSPIRFVGFAHGWIGILYSLLSWGRHHNPAVVAATLPFLLSLNKLKVQCQLGSYWPANFDQPHEAGDTPSWCSGSGGFVLLWTEAFLATKDNNWLSLAREAAIHTALHHDMAFDLCCGLAGRAFCLGALHRVTGEGEWLQHAHNCLSRATPIPGRFLHSLFKGIPGIELARAELARPELLTFPTLAIDRYGERMSVGSLGDR